jgi:hypothetical protein
MKLLEWLGMTQEPTPEKTQAQDIKLENLAQTQYAMIQAANEFCELADMICQSELRKHLIRH